MADTAISSGRPPQALHAGRRREYLEFLPVKPASGPQVRLRITVASCRYGPAPRTIDDGALLMHCALADA
jgi:hypothetical protein